RRLLFRSDPQRFVFKPTTFSGQNKLWKLTLWLQSAQEGICFDQPHQILSRLNGTERQNVIAFDAISFPNSSQFCFIGHAFEALRRRLVSHGNKPGGDAVSPTYVL